jgi:uncharacterized protein
MPRRTVLETRSGYTPRVNAVSPRPLRPHFPRASGKSRDRLAAAAKAARSVGSATRDSGHLDPSSTFTELARAASASPDLWDVLTICVTACLSLGVVQFVGSEQSFILLFSPDPRDPYWYLRYKAWWVACIVVSFLAVPAITMALLPGRRLRDCNLSFAGFRAHFRLYVLLYLVVLPAIWLVSLSPAFNDFYPMYPFAGRSWFDLLAWESLYFAQFIALEFFFRGFLVGGLARHIGFLSVPVAVMPYMMLHFQKPWPEAAASVIAGLVLGALAWKTKSIWGGVCVHCAVASTMDLLALAHKSQLPWLHH